MATGQLAISDSTLGRDAILGTTIAAVSTMLRERKSADYPEEVVTMILRGLGVCPADAAEIARRPLPPLLLAEPPNQT